MKIYKTKYTSGLQTYPTYVCSPDVYLVLESSGLHRGVETPGVLTTVWVSTLSCRRSVRYLSDAQWLPSIAGASSCCTSSSVPAHGNPKHVVLSPRGGGALCVCALLCRSACAVEICHLLLTSLLLTTTSSPEECGDTRGVAAPCESSIITYGSSCVPAGAGGTRVRGPSPWALDLYLYIFD